MKPLRLVLATATFMATLSPLHAETRSFRGSPVCREVAPICRTFVDTVPVKNVFGYTLYNRFVERQACHRAYTCGYERETFDVLCDSSGCFLRMPDGVHRFDDVFPDGARLVEGSGGDAGHDGAGR